MSCYLLLCVGFIPCRPSVHLQKMEIKMAALHLEPQSQDTIVPFLQQTLRNKCLQFCVSQTLQTHVVCTHMDPPMGDHKFSVFLSFQCSCHCTESEWSPVCACFHASPPRGRQRATTFLSLSVHPHCEWFPVMYSLLLPLLGEGRGQAFLSFKGPLQEICCWIILQFTFYGEPS